MVQSDTIIFNEINLMIEHVFLDLYMNTYNSGNEHKDNQTPINILTFIIY